MVRNHLPSLLTNIFKTYGCFLVFSFSATILPPASVKAQALHETSLQVSGELKTPLTLTATAIDTMKQQSIVVKDKSNKEHTYSGTDLFEILKKAGVTLGEDLKGRNLAKYMLAEASDGYKVVFSLAEADPSFSHRRMILANRKDNVLLPLQEGPFHLIVEGELRQSRFVRQVVSIKIKHAE